MKQKANQKIKSGYDRWKRNVLRRCLNIASDGADVTCDGRLFQKLAPETGKARLPTVERLNGGTASWLQLHAIKPSNNLKSTLDDWSSVAKFRCRLKIRTYMTYCSD